MPCTGRWRATSSSPTAFTGAPALARGQLAGPGTCNATWAGGRPPNSALMPDPWRTAWGVLGAPRLHHTVVTGEVISKEAAGEHALAGFDPRWHPIIREALGYWRGEPADRAFADRRVRNVAAGQFVLEVVAAAHAARGGTLTRLW